VTTNGDHRIDEPSFHPSLGMVSSGPVTRSSRLTDATDGTATSPAITVANALALRAWYRATIPEFLESTIDATLGQLATNARSVNRRCGDRVYASSRQLIDCSARGKPIPPLDRRS